MAGIKKETQREISVSIVGGASAQRINFNSIGGELPNVFQIRNYSIGSLNVGKVPTVSESQNFIIQIASSGGVGILTDPKGLSELYIFSSANANVVITSWVSDEIFSNELYQTLSTVIINSTTTSSVTLAAPIPAGTNNIGKINIEASLPEGNNNIGNVDIESMPNVVIAAGTNNIGDVDVLTLPPLPAGTNNIGDVDVLTLPSLPAGTNNIGDVDVLTLPSLPAGTNNIGDVDVLTLPSLPAGTNNIGKIDTVRIASSIGTGSVYGRCSVSTSATEIKVGASKLSNRTCVMIKAHPNNTDNIFIGLDSSVTSSTYFYVLAAGDAVSLEMDSADAQALYCIGGSGTQYMGLLESKHS